MTTISAEPALQASPQQQHSQQQHSHAPTHQPHHDDSKPAADSSSSDAASSRKEATLNPGIKHPLQHAWTMWYDCPPKKMTASAWGDQLRKVVTVSTVEDFWGLYNNCIPASHLAVGANYHFFKEGIEPKWEDPSNERGGKWLLVLPPKARNNGMLDRLWLWTLLACIGEAFDEETEICGAVVSMRKGGDKIALWTRNASNEAATKRVGRALKAALELPDEQPLTYQLHADPNKPKSSFSNKPRYDV